MHRFTSPFQVVLLSLTGTLSLLVLLSGSVTAVETDDPILWPSANSHTAPVTTSIGITFPVAIEPVSVHSRTFVVHGSQHGRIKGTYTVSDNTVEFRPDLPFFPNELVETTVTTGMVGVSGPVLVTPVVWQFRTATYSSGSYTTVETNLSVGGILRNVDVGDLDSDGDLDVVIGQMEQSYPDIRLWTSIWLNNGAGCFTENRTSPTIELWDKKYGAAGGSYLVSVADLDSDSVLDVITLSDKTIRIWKNNGRGEFKLDKEWPKEINGVVGAEMSDLDGDGDRDLFVTTTCIGTNPDLFCSVDRVWLNDGHGSLAPDQKLGYGHSTPMRLGDMDNDYDLDALHVSTFLRQHSLWKNNGQGELDRSVIMEGFMVRSLELGDLDNDGDLDAMMSVHDKGVGDIWLNDGSGHLDEAQHLGKNYYTPLIDADGDGDLDVFTHAIYGRKPKLLVNQGDATFVSKEVFPLGTVGSVQAIGDLDGDGDADMILGGEISGLTVWFDTDGDIGPDQCPYQQWLPVLSR